MLTIELPEDIDSRFEALTQTMGRSKADLVHEAILAYLEDFEDHLGAKQELTEIREGRSRTYTLNKVEQKLGLAE